MVLRFYLYCLPCLLVRGRQERVEWVRCKSDRVKDWIAATREQFPGWSYDHVLCWEVG